MRKMISQFSSKHKMIFSLVWNTMVAGDCKVLVLKFYGDEQYVFFRAKKLMEI